MVRIDDVRSMVADSARRPADMRFNWVVAKLRALEPEDIEEYVFDAWRMVVPKRVAAEVVTSRGGV